MSLMKRIMEQRLRQHSEQLARVAPAAVVTSAPGPRGSCKAINADTGRQCALLASHSGAHQHGRTAFWRTAEPGQTSFTRRDALDAAATNHPHHGDVA